MKHYSFKPFAVKEVSVMNNLKSKTWWEAAGIRAIKTMAQTAIASISTAAVLEEVNWTYVISATLLAGLISVLMNIQGIPEVDLVDKVEEK